MSKFRQREKEIIELLTHEDQRIKRDTLRGCGATHTFGKNHRDGWKKGDKGKKVKKGGKGRKKGGKGDKYHNWWETGKSSWEKQKKGWYTNDWNKDRTDDKIKAPDEPSTEKTSDKAKKKK